MSGSGDGVGPGFPLRTCGASLLVTCMGGDKYLGALWLLPIFQQNKDILPLLPLMVCLDF